MLVSYEENFKHDKGRQTLVIVVITLEVLIDVNSLIMAYSIAKIKQSQDCLQGISKLDYLLKVSEFQKYKEEITTAGRTTNT